VDKIEGTGRTARFPEASSSGRLYHLRCEGTRRFTKCVTSVEWESKSGREIARKHGPGLERTGKKGPTFSLLLPHPEVQSPWLKSKQGLLAAGPGWCWLWEPGSGAQHCTEKGKQWNWGDGGKQTQHPGSVLK
jgi:hypothetical protein